MNTKCTKAKKTEEEGDSSAGEDERTRQTGERASDGRRRGHNETRGVYCGKDEDVAVFGSQWLVHEGSKVETAAAGDGEGDGARRDDVGGGGLCDCPEE